jgi:TonB family protein
VAVVLSIDVAADGTVERAAVAEGAGEPFDSAALAAARRFEFEPGRLASGEAVPVTVTFRMRIQAPPPAPPPVKLAIRLLERGTRRPLGDVAVVARSGDRVVGRATTGLDGRAALEVPEAEFVLSAAPAGHQRLSAPVSARPGQERDETFYLEATGGESETVVSATPLRREVTREVLSADLVAKVPGSQGDTLKAILNLPGTARTPFGAGLLVLRGSSPGDSRVFLEGQEIPQLFHFGGLRSTFAPRFLEAVEVIPGNFPADYGRAEGGIVDVRVRDPATDMLRGEADLNFYDAGVALEGPLGKEWSVGGSFRRSWIDSILPLFLPSNANLSFSTAPRFYDYQFIATWKPDALQRLRLMFYGSMDRVVALFDRPARDPTITGTVAAQVGFHTLQADSFSILGPSLRQDTSLALGLQEIDTQIGPQYFFDLRVRRASLRSTWTWEASPALQARGGIDARVDAAGIALNVPQQSGNGQPAPPPSTLPVIGVDKRVTLYAPAAFAEVSLTPLPAWSVVPSLRLDWYSAIDRFTLDPRLVTRWQVSGATALKAGIGLFQQAPQPQESDPDTGNPHLLAERSLQASAGVEQRILPGLDLSVTGFYKWLDRQVVRDPASAYDPSAPRYTNDGTGRIYGAEILLRATLGRFAGWIACTLQRSLRTDPGQPERPFGFDQPGNLTALGIYDLGRGWSSGARFRFVSGNPYTPVTGSVFDAATDVYVATYGPVSSARLANFWALDLRIDKQWVFEAWKLGLYLDVQNVTNRTNQEGWTYNYDYSQRSPTSGLPILPILGLKGEW